jgi:nicotinamidase-related amidase
VVTFSINPKTTAVLAIDLQNCFVENSPVAAPDGVRVVERVSGLVRRFREAGSLIVWTRHVVRPDHADVGILGVTAPPVSAGIINEGCRSSALHAAVDLENADIILGKPQFGCFQSTSLDSILRARGIDTVLIGGIATNFCCETTAREAHAREYKVLFLSDGTATFDLPDSKGARIAAADLQRHALATLAFGFAEVLSCSDAVERLVSVAQ